MSSSTEPLPTLRGPRLLLRPFVQGDADAFVEAARESVATVGRWMPWCRADYRLDEAQAWISRCSAAWQQGQQREFGFFDALTGRLLGGGGLNGLHADLPLANLGYWVRESAQRQGLAVEAAGLLARHGFADLGLQRLEIVVAQGNEASAAVAQRAGATCEGLLRLRTRTPEGLADAWMFSLVPPDAFAPPGPPVPARAPLPKGFAPRETVGCYAVIFTSHHAGALAGYDEAAQHMVDLAAQQRGYLGMESVRGADGMGITVSYWRTAADIIAWRQQAQHTMIREQGRAEWYSHYELRVAKVERAYGWDAGLG
jgi:RimJ/RimL family protein N-acetyltransferase/heme-degrading monooxygenase HmoA